MWIGSVRLVVPGAGAEEVRAGGAKPRRPPGAVPVVLLRDGLEVARLPLEPAVGPRPADGTGRGYDYPRLPRVPERSPLLLHGAGGRLTSYPEYGVEYGNGLHGHLRVRLLADEATMAGFEGVTMFARRLRRRVAGPRRIVWVEDEAWTFLGTWGCGIPVTRVSPVTRVDRPGGGVPAPGPAGRERATVRVSLPKSRPISTPMSARMSMV